MIQITPQMRILVALESVDGRKGIDSLARLCQEKLQADPFSGCLFVFRNRHGTDGRPGEQLSRQAAEPFDQGSAGLSAHAALS
jgi:transposase